MSKPQPLILLTLILLTLTNQTLGTTNKITLMLGTKILGTKIVDVETLRETQIKIQVLTLDLPILGKVVVEEGSRVEDPLIIIMPPK